MIKIKNLTKKFGNFIAVNNLSFDINDGEIFGFIGHNGAGKTTTIKNMVGLLPVDDGDILYDDLSIKKDTLACKRNIAYIPDNPDLYDFLSGIKYLNFIADIFEVSDKDRTERIKEYSAILGLTDDLYLPISAYSHGMKQKLSLISAFLHNPKYIILDEPFVGLDPKASHSLKEMMKKHCANGGIIFYSTHVLEVAEKLCDKIAIIKNGKLVTIGDMEDVIKDSSLEEVFLELEENKNVADTN